MPVPLLRITPPRLGGQTNPIDPYLPGQEMVDQERMTAEQERPNFFFRLLEIPGRLLGGQSVQGFLEGYGEDGVGEGLRKAFVNNPLFQLFQITGIGDDTLGDVLEGVGLKEEGSVGLTEDTHFAKVREAFGWDVGDNVAANIAVDLIGELVTSPLEFMWTPFGMTSKGMKAAQAARKAGAPAVGLGKQVVKGSTGFGGLAIDSVEQISPDVLKATEQGFKSMMAFKVPFLEKGFTVPVPKTLNLAAAHSLRNTADFLNTSRLTAPVIGLFNRNIAKLGGLGDDIAKAAYPGKALTGPERRFVAGEIITQFDEFNAQFMSEFMTKFSQIMEQAPETVKGDKTLNNLVSMMIEGDIQKADEMNDIIARIQQGYKSKQELNPNFIDEDIIEEFPGHSATPGMVTRAQEANKVATGQAPGTVQRVEAYRADVPEMFKAINEAEDPKKLFEDLKEMAIGLKSLGEDLHAAEGMEKILDEAMMPYMPRIMSDEVRKAVDARFAEYFKGRKMSELTTLEINAILLEQGTKVTDFKSVRQLMTEAPPGTVEKIMGKVFSSDFLSGLRKKYGKDADDVVDFLNTNQNDIWYRRIEQAAKRGAVKDFWKNAFGPNSKLVIEERQLADLLADPELITKMSERGLRAVTVSENGVFYEPEKTTISDLLKDAMDFNDRGKIQVARARSKTNLSAMLATGKVGFDDLKEPLKELKAQNVRYRSTAKPAYIKNFSDMENLKARAERISIMEDDLNKVKSGPFADDPLVHVMEEQVEYLRAWDDKPMAFLDDDQRRLVETDPKSKEAKAALKFGEKQRNFAWDTLRSQEQTIRKGLDEEISALEQGFKEFRSQVEGSSKAQKKTLTKLGKDKITDKETTEDLWDRYLVWKRHKERGAVAVDELRELDPDAYAALEKNAKDARVVFVDDEMYEEFLNPETGILSRLNKPDKGWMKSIFEALHLDSFTSAWKATTLNPVFGSTRFRDLMSTAFMFVQGGVRPQKIAANSWMHRGFYKAFDDFLKTGKTEAMDAHFASLPENIKTALAREGVDDGVSMFHLMQSKGIITKNIVEERFVVQTGDKYIDLNKGKKWEEVVKDKDIGEFFTKISMQRVGIFKDAHKFGENLESGVRMSAFFDWLDQGLTVGEATKNVRKWGYDPRRIDLSSAERHVFRRFLPFYGFARKAVEMQTEAFFKSPGKVTWFEKLQKAAWNFQGMNEYEMEAAIPEFVRDGFGIPVEVDENGNPRVKLLGTMIPIAQAGDIANAIADSFDPESSDSIRNYLGKQLNPSVKVPMELLLNHSYFTQRPIERFPGQQVEYLGVNMSPKLKHTLMSVRFLNAIDNLGILTPEQTRAAMVAAGDQQDHILKRILSTPFSPLQPLVKDYTVEVGKQVDWEARKEGRELSKARSELKRAIADPNESLSDENVSALQKQIAKKLARLEILKETAQRYQR